MSGPGTERPVRFRENCFVRATPSAAGAVLGVMKRGDALPWGGGASPDGWVSVMFRGGVGWASGRFAVRGDGKDPPHAALRSSST